VQSILSKVINSTQQLMRNTLADVILSKTAPPAHAASNKSNTTDERLRSIGQVLKPDTGRTDGGGSQTAASHQLAPQPASRPAMGFPPSMLFNQPSAPSQQEVDFGNLGPHVVGMPQPIFAPGLGGMPGTLLSMPNSTAPGMFVPGAALPQPFPTLPGMMHPGGAMAIAQHAAAPVPMMPPQMPQQMPYAVATSMTSKAASTGASGSVQPSSVPAVMGTTGAKPSSGSASSLDPSALRAEEAAVSIMRALNLGVPAAKKTAPAKGRGGRRQAS
jgi:hypothetical protein